MGINYIKLGYDNARARDTIKSFSSAVSNDPKVHWADNKLRRISLFASDQFELDQEKVLTKATIKRIIALPAFIALAPLVSITGFAIEGYYEVKDIIDKASRGY